MVSGQVKVEGYAGLRGVNVRPAANLLDELITNCIFNTAGSILAVGDARITHIGIHGQCLVWSHVAAPVDGAYGFVKFIRIVNGSFKHWNQYANGCPQTHVGSVKI
jgi:hypothetical protein